jgi:hypothetical protein
MDDERRFWIAQQVGDTKEKADVRQLLQKGKEIANTKPLILITMVLTTFTSHTTRNTTQ